MSEDLPALNGKEGLIGLVHNLSTLVPSASSSTNLLKRRASSSFEEPGATTNKKMKENIDESSTSFPKEEADPMAISPTFVEDITQELQCGCCAEIVYRPVLVMPCQHFFCGSCVVLWVRNGGSSCPACRGAANVAVPFRALQPVIDAMIRNVPHKARTVREREQADEVYKANLPIRIPPPREASPPPDVNRSTEYVHPCPHCLPSNPYDWRCPQPIADPSIDLERAWHVDDGVPPGHANCGNCENLLALRAPTTTKCDLCLVSFCGIGVQDRCIALPLLSQTPHNLSTHADLILSSEVYDCFDGNTIEAEIMLEYMGNNGISPRHVYREIVHYIQKMPRGFVTLIELELFTDIHAVAPGTDTPNVDAPRSRACRMCAAEIFLWGLKEWWVRERQKGFLEECYLNRKDCPDAEMCIRQKDDLAHAREFNHIFASRVLDAPEQGTSRDEALARTEPFITESLPTSSSDVMEHLIVSPVIPTVPNTPLAEVPSIFMFSRGVRIEENKDTIPSELPITTSDSITTDLIDTQSQLLS